MECAKVAPAVRKGKKKQVKDELDRIKQAEKKKRRLEKALATSAAIRSELEKKKQKKKEEQQRLDEQGAAIAEAVALQVLLGEDTDDSCKLLLKKEEGWNTWDLNSSFDFFVGRGRPMLPRQDSSTCYSVEGADWVSGASGYRCMSNEMGNSEWMVSSETWVRDEGNWEVARISPGFIAAQSLSSLQIAEDAPVDSCVFNQVEGVN
ncbi:hypothetical protein EJD97_002298 [Solanum chilense]|uniref:Uncharacterized protein n=1 Tax=Solanum chilense TaxID=4083 RepID=A0A6N2BW07_SOLCI|nr:hypothetical protein EJD97_002298 [Solanum chilense]